MSACCNDSSVYNLYELSQLNMLSCHVCPAKASSCLKKANRISLCDIKTRRRGGGVEVICCNPLKVGDPKQNQQSLFGSSKLRYMVHKSSINENVIIITSLHLGIDMCIHGQLANYS